MNGLSFAQDTEGNWGYKAPGADTVFPFKSLPDITLYPDSGYQTSGTAYITYTFDKPDGYNYITINFTPNYVSGGYVKINNTSIYSGKSNYTDKIDISSYSKISLSLSSGKGNGTYSRASATVTLSTK